MAAEADDPNLKGQLLEQAAAYRKLAEERAAQLGKAPRPESTWVMCCRNALGASGVFIYLSDRIVGDILSYLNDPEHWRDRARQTRAMAETVTDSATKRAMLTVADEYDELARRAEDRRSGKMFSPRE